MVIVARWSLEIQCRGPGPIITLLVGAIDVINDYYKVGPQPVIDGVVTLVSRVITPARPFIGHL